MPAKTYKDDFAGQLAFSLSSVDELHDNTSVAIFTKSIMNGDLNAE